VAAEGGRSALVVVAVVAVAVVAVAVIVVVVVVVGWVKVVEQGLYWWAPLQQVGASKTYNVCACVCGCVHVCVCMCECIQKNRCQGKEQYSNAFDCMKQCA